LANQTECGGGSPFRQTEGSQRDGYPASTAGRRSRPHQPRSNAPSSLRPVRYEPRGCIRTHACWPDIVAVPATRCLEPPDYVSWRSSDNRAGITRSTVGAVAPPRPIPVVTMDEVGMSVHRTRLVGNPAGRGRPALRPMCRVGRGPRPRRGLLLSAWHFNAGCPSAQDRDAGPGWSTRADALPCVTTRAARPAPPSFEKLETRN
jgi:hypothetical protein